MDLFYLLRSNFKRSKMDLENLTIFWGASNTVDSNFTIIIIDNIRDLNVLASE